MSFRANRNGFEILWWGGGRMELELLRWQGKVWNLDDRRNGMGLA